MQFETLLSQQESSNSKQLTILKQHFPHCFDKNGAFLPEKLTETVSQEIPISKEFYSLNWLGKSYARLLANQPATTLLSEDKVHNQKPENQHSENLLLCGDNLEVLKHLKQAYAEQVKMIYIDPPYNTGSDGFVYQDDRKFSPEQLAELANVSIDEAKRILEFTDRGSNSHSAWLTFMYPRLYVARELLREDGVIFISIDDNEVAQLKLLCDEVFGEENFVACLVWALGTGTQAGHFVRAHENILVYFKKKELVDNFSGGEGIIEHSALKKISAKNPESEFLFPKGTRWDAPDNFELFGSWGGSEKTTLKKGRMICRNNQLVEDVVLSAGWAQKGQMKTWFKGLHTVDSKGQKVLSFHFNKNGVLRYEKERSVINPPTVLQDIASTKNGSDEIKSFFNENIFNYPKPTDLMKFLVEIATNNDDVILDFFAGSGSIADAIMQLNAEVETNIRKFILIQLPEDLDIALEKASKENKQSIRKAIDYLDSINKPHLLSEITKSRLEKAAAKIKLENPNASGDFAFKIYQTVEDFRFVEEQAFDPNQAQLPSMLNAMLTEEQHQTLLTTWALYDGASLTTPIENIDLAGYGAHLCQRHLYLIAPNFTSQAVKALIEKLDSDDNFSPNHLCIFGANMDSSMQQELAQAVKSYSNKKNISFHIKVRN
ncbi:hypothetical protein BMT54_02970 [Pasteurellaceae bacterium 15-036681]|nr:hypothetical protein BMT54_02970 [Pasteurellaceae bacterium 15-036681]